MPQELHVLRCYGCKTFQVHIVKKVPKWQCKVCNEKQSVLKVYAKGSGKDCRQYVQELNLQQGLLMSAEPVIQHVQQHTRDPDPDFEIGDALASGNVTGHLHPQHHRSKWDDYLVEEGSTDSLCETETDTQGEMDNFKLSNPQISTGRKRKADHLRDDCTEDFNFSDKKVQSVEVHTSSASLQNPHPAFQDQSQKLRQANRVTEDIVTSYSAPKSHKSKWSEYTSTQESSVSVKDSPEKSHDSVGTNYNSNCLRVVKSHKSPSVFKSSEDTDHNVSRSLRDEFRITTAKPKSKGSVPLNPFSISEDENLDSLLDF